MAARRRLVARREPTALGLTGHVPEPARPRGQGIVEPGAEAARSRPRSSRSCAACATTRRRRSAIREAFDTAKIYAGPYLENAPDFIIGYNAGYRISWDCATGIVSGPVFEDNIKPWSGDHCIDPRLVPGVFFCNRTVDADGAGARRHRADRAAAVRHRAAAAHGRPAAGGAGVRRAAGSSAGRVRRARSRSLLLASRRAPCGSTARDRAQGHRARLRRPRLRRSRAQMIEQRPPAGVCAARRSGGFAPLGTSIPPQSPGGLVDVHHRPRSRRPRHLRLHPSRSEDDDAVSVDDEDRGARRARSGSASGSCRCRAARWNCCARGQPFWELLEAHGVPTTIIRMPANFPPSGTATRELSGMGTPDMLGTYGTFALLHLRAVCVCRPDAVGRRRCTSVEGARRRGAGRARRARQSVPARRRRKCTAEFTRVSRSRRTST